MYASLQRMLWKTERIIMDYKACILCIYLLIVRVECKTFWNNSLQRRFMWKQMDETVDDLMDGVMSGARVMKNMLGELLPSSSNSVRHVSSIYDYLPSETTRVKYIFRSPSGKPMKTIKVRPPKKTIKIMAVPPKANIDGKYYKPKMKFPSAEDMRKLEKQQERIVEGKMPKKSSAEIMAEIESEKQVKELKLESSEQAAKSSQELKAEREAEKQVVDTQKPAKMIVQQEKPQQFQKQKAEKPLVEHASDIVSGHIKEFDEEWLPVQQHQPEYHEEAKWPAPFSTIKPFPLSYLHTTITSSWPAWHSNQEVFKSRPLSKLHTTIIGSRRPETIVEKPIYEEPVHDQHLYVEPPKRPIHTYEVTEYTAEESMALPLQQEYHQTREQNLAYEAAAEASIRYKLPVIRTTTPQPREALREHEKHYTSTSSTTSTSTTTTTEEPNYPAEFLRKYRERTAVVSTLQTPVRYRPSSEKLLDDTSWIPSTRNRSYASPLKGYRNTNTRTRSDKWSPEVPTAKAFGTEEAASSVVESAAQIKIETTPEPARTKRRKQMRFITPLPESGEGSESNESAEIKPREVRQRGRVRFGDKLNPDEY